MRHVGIQNDDRVSSAIGEAVEAEARRRFRLLAASRIALRMGNDPRLDRRARPHASRCELDLGLREVLVCLDQLRDTLPADAEDLRDLRHADEMVHRNTIEHPLRYVKG